MFSRGVLLYKLRGAAVSLTVLLVFMSFIGWLAYRYWYPDYLFWSDGGVQGLRLIFAVDFVLGPVLALVFFHPDKSRRKLLFDIVVVACVQFSAMAWGAYQVYSQRPLAVVHGSGRFTSVAPAIMALQYKSSADLARYSTARPPYVYRREPRSSEERQRQLAMLWRHGFHLEAQAWLFEPFRENLEKVFDRQAGTREYIRNFMRPDWERWAEKREARALEDYRLGFYEGRYRNAVLIFTPQGEYLDYLPMGDAPLPNIPADPVSR